MMRALFAIGLISLVACGGAVVPTTSSSGGGTPGTPVPSPPGTSDPVPAQPPTPASSPTACSACLSASVAWAPNGGLGPGYTDGSTLVGCGEYTHERNGTQNLVCTDTLASCAHPGSVTTDDVVAALADPEVARVLDETTALYGSDPRGCDGAVLDLTIGARTFEVGGECGRAGSCGPISSPCVPTPAGLQRLVDLLTALDQQELAKPACAAFH